MERMTALLKGHLQLLGRLEEASELLEKTLIANDGDEAGRLAITIEQLTNDLAKLEKASSLYLNKKDAASWRDFIERLPDSPERSLAEELLARIYGIIASLKKNTLRNSVYLDRDVKFVNYNINVLTGVKAGPTYASDAAEAHAGPDVAVFRGQA